MKNDEHQRLKLTITIARERTEKIVGKSYRAVHPYKKLAKCMIK